MNQYRLALDMGTNSIGWCALALDKDARPTSILDMGSRVFPDGRNPKDGASNAVARRMARGMRRNRDRFLERRKKLMDALMDAGLMPTDERARQALTTLDPYALRAKGLEEKLSLYELGRALFHLNQRRGFKSNRKTDTPDKETGAMKAAIHEQQEKMDALGARTFGEYLFLRREKGEPVRSRLKSRAVVDPQGKEKQQEYYDLYPDRNIVQREFEQLWRIQAKHHPGLLSDEQQKRIGGIIFDQRPLKPQVVGKCTFEHAEDRVAKVFPMVQQCRIYQELNHLQVLDTKTLRGRPLTKEERDILAKKLCEPKGKKSGKSETSFNQMRKDLKLTDRTVFSIESEKRKGLEADTTSALIAHQDRFGKRWYDLSMEERDNVVGALLHIADEEELIGWLIEEWGVDRKHAEAISCTPLAEGYSRLGLTATRKILDQLIEDVIPYSEAVLRAGYASHSQFATGAARPRLPYYGEVLDRHVIPDPEFAGHPAAPLEKRYGKVTNPTVHIAMNQLRKVVNEIIKLYGPPAEVHVEVLRDLKNSLKKKKEIVAEQAENQKKNDECARKLREEFHLPVNRENIQRLRLWGELGAAERVCVYTGESITPKNLFSDEVEIDHILPMSRTLDDSMANKILCKRRGNREKTNRTPFEAWGKTPDWQELLDRTSVLSKNKRWRFGADAMERYKKESDFIARQLTDSQYIARLARAYLSVLYSPQEEYKVVCLPGRLTGLFRYHLGLHDILDEINPAREDSKAPRGEKNRDDHRHHAVDALLVGLMDRGFLQRAASISARLEKEGVQDFLQGFGEPWPGFRAEAAQALARTIVSHKLDHGIEGALHNDTAYGFAKRPDDRGAAIHRIPIQNIKATNILRIRGKNLRAALVAALSGRSHRDAFKLLQTLDDSTDTSGMTIEQLCDPDGKGSKDMEARIAAFFRGQGIRRVRVIESIALIPIENKRHEVYKGFKPDANAYLDVFESSGGDRWEGEMVTCFDANARKAKTKNGPATGNAAKDRHVKRLFNRDMLEMEHQGTRRVFYIQKMSERQIALAEHFEANADSRTRDANDPFRFVYKGGAEPLRKAGVRFLVVSPAGKIRYLSDGPDDPPGD